MMILNSLTAISPLDGRYRDQVESLDRYFSEFALMRYRLKVEILYFEALCELPLPQLAGITPGDRQQLPVLVSGFSEADARRIKEIEKITRHDVKAVEYFLKEKFEELGLAAYKEFVHFGLTSQDVNNTALPMAIRDALEQVYHPLVGHLLEKLRELAARWADVAMLARTHGQPASPTRLGKEILVFAERLENQWTQLKSLRLFAKFGGATGNFNAHHVAYPLVAWHDFADRFTLEKLGLPRYRHTTQVAHYDDHGAIFDAMKRINTILTDLDQDLWFYISMNYFTQKTAPGEVGSSTMPHKINPIDFENSEGNLGFANAVLEHLSRKLPVSRLQRDLTDSTVTRNVGVPFAHTVLAIHATIRGLEKLVLNREAIEEDLNRNWAVVAEAIQTILRRESYPCPYEVLKDLTRATGLADRESLHNFIDTLDVPERVKAELKQVTPQNYTGIF